MSTRRSLRLPITLGVIMIVLLVALTVGWVLLAVFGVLSREGPAPLYWTLLTVGTACIGVVLVGVVMYLVLSIKAINLTRRQSNFVDSVTHELKSPIASLKLYLQTLGRRQVPQQQQQDFCQFMLDDVERLDELINHLLAAARLERRSFDVDVDDIDLSHLLTQIAAVICQRYHVSEETVCLDLQPCIVRAARGDLDMIFRNLIDNAVKYGGAQPKVGISLRSAPASQVVIRIADNGRGIPRKLRRKMFGRFVRLGRELERERPGTGLGLYIVRTLVTRLHGRIKVHDAIQGTGTVFEVYLPGRSKTNKAESQPQKAETAEVA